MEKYELTVVLPGDAKEAKRKSAREKIEKLVKTLKGKVEKVDDRGKVDLAYEIKENKSGIFLIFGLELDSKHAKTIDDKLRMEEEIIRYLLVKSEE